MKTITLILIAALDAMAIASRAEDALDWYTINGGGGPSAGGVYAVAGTIGQPDAGALTGASYTLGGGFWSGADDRYHIYLPLVVRNS